MQSNYKVRSECAICGFENLDTIMEFGEVPLAGDYPEEPNIKENYNLTLMFCNQCKLLQTDSIISADRLFEDYRYMSSIGLSNHFSSVAVKLRDYFALTPESSILEIGSNDGVLLQPMMSLGLNPKGIEPAKNIAKISQEKGCDVLVDYFSEDLVEGIGWGEKFDLIISNNCFAHIDGINSIVSGIKKALKPEGHLVIEVHYVEPLIRSLQYDNIYHEHIYYYSLNSLNYLFNSHGMSIVDFDFIPIHAGSVRVYVQNSPDKTTPSVKWQLNQEAVTGLTNVDWYKEFASKATKHISDTKEFLINLSKTNTIAGYGASGRANILCNLCDFNKEIISFIVDESPERSNRYIAGTDIPIVSKQYLDNSKVNYIVIFAWNFAKMIIEKLEGQGHKFLVPFPYMQEVTTASELCDFVGV